MSTQRELTPTEQETLATLKQVLNLEPKWVTHPMSVWNRARRLIVLLETGEEISMAKSYDADTRQWKL